jgi:predicted DNA-binding transcriptional regulator YafY
MDRTERFYKIDQLLNEKIVVSIETFLDDLGVSLATFKRDLEYMRERLHAPILWDRDAGGYRYTQPDPLAPTFALPGLWFNSGEVHALITMQQLLSNLEPGLLAGHIKPLQARLNALLESQDHSAAEVETRFRIVHAARRQVTHQYFELVATATLSRKRLKVRHYSRETGEETERVISPQQLVYYRDNWYVDSWCHLRNGIRSFSIDAITNAEILKEKTKEVSRSKLKEALENGYGIFSGKAVTWARLRFSSERARWVSKEQWHPQQKGRFEEDGSYLLEVPFSDNRELIMDILRHGAEVEVISPQKLRKRVGQELKSALKYY